MPEQPAILAVPIEDVNALLGEVAALLGCEALVLFAMDTQGVTRVVYNGPIDPESLASRMCLKIHMGLLSLGKEPHIAGVGDLRKAGSA